MFCNVIGEKEMPVYEYECQECNKVFEVQQKIADEPLRDCPECQAPVKKLMSMSSFQLKGGGWYADGYASKSSASSSSTPSAAAADKPATDTAGKTKESAGCSTEKKASCGCGQS